MPTRENLETLSGPLASESVERWEGNSRFGILLEYIRILGLRRCIKWMHQQENATCPIAMPAQKDALEIEAAASRKQGLVLKRQEDWGCP